MRGIVEITSVTDAKNAVCTVLTDFPLGSTDATWRWAEGSWSDYRGWPKTIAFHQQRAVYGGSDSYPAALWFSALGADYYDDFTAGALDTDAFWYHIPGQNPIQWLISSDYLLIGTSSSVGKYGKQGQAITPSTPSYQEQSEHGAADIQAVTAGDIVIYAERGARKVREFGYALQYDKYTTPDLTILSEEITDPCVIEMTFQARPQPTLWCVLSDGEIATLSYHREQLVAGWSRQSTDGDFKSLIATPGSGTTPAGETWLEDCLWAVAERTVDGSDNTYIEQITPVEWGDPNYCFFVDSGAGLTVDGSDANFYDGLEHLIGETVGVYADLESLGDYTVDADGMVEIGSGYTTVIAGLKYYSKLETLPLKIVDMSNRQTQGVRIADKKITALHFDLLDTYYLEYGMGANSTPKTMDFEEIISDTVKFSRVAFPFGTYVKPTIYIQTNKPVPLGLRGIFPEITYYRSN